MLRNVAGGRTRIFIRVGESSCAQREIHEAAESRVITPVAPATIRVERGTTPVTRLTHALMGRTRRVALRPTVYPEFQLASGASDALDDNTHRPDSPSTTLRGAP